MVTEEQRFRCLRTGRSGEYLDLRGRKIERGWRRMHNEELREVHTKFWSESLKGRDHVEDLNVDGRIISEWNLGK
jgi:hypothetical protein